MRDLPTDLPKLFGSNFVAKAGLAEMGGVLILFIIGLHAAAGAAWGVAVGGARLGCRAAGAGVAPALRGTQGAR